MSPTEVAKYDVAEVSLGPAHVPPASPASTAVDVTFVEPNGQERRVPAFISQGEWRVRYSSGQAGVHRYHGEAAEAVSLPNADGEVRVAAVSSDAGGLRSHGPLQIAPDQRRLQHADGTPFLWLADTWWHGFVQRLSDDEFRDLADKRVRQGYSVVQIVAGLYPEMPPFAPEGLSHSGWAWHDDFSAPNLAWFDEADRRVLELVERDLVPCIVGCWAYYLRFMDAQQMLRHWREMIARWGAYPVVWCLAGEPVLIQYEEIMPAVREVADRLPDSATEEEIVRAAFAQVQPVVSDQLKRLNEVAHGVRRLEPFGRLVTVHSVPGYSPWEFFEDEGVVDFWLLQTGHGGAKRMESAVNAVYEALEHKPTKPVINGEPSYEGIGGSSWQEIQRFQFWSHVLSGAAGHTYGAHGIWAFNTPEFPGFYSGRAPMWKDAAEFTGGAQVGLGRRLLLELPWHEFERHPEWVLPHQSSENRLLPYAAGVAGGPRVIYFPAGAGARKLRGLEGATWRAQLIDPRTGETEPELVIEPEADGTATLNCGYRGTPGLPSLEDWVLVLQPES